MNFVVNVDLLDISKWQKRRFLIFSISIELAFLGAFFLNTFNSVYSYVQICTGAVLLMVLPGSCLLKSLNIRYNSFIKTILITIGLSTAYVILFGISINAIYPNIFDTPPFSNSLLVPSFLIFQTALTILAYRQEKRRNLEAVSHKTSISINNYLLIVILSFLLSVLSSFLRYDLKLMILVICIVIMACIPIVVYYKKIPPTCYPFILFATSLTILYQTSLFSNQVVGTDVFGELGVLVRTLDANHWDPSLSGALNAVTSVTILPVLYVKICSISPSAFYKVFIPLFASLVPLSAYYLYNQFFKDLLSKENIFLAAFVSVSLYQFIGVLLGVPRQIIAEFFYLILLIQILEDKNSLKTTSLILIISLCLIISHYSMAYLFALSMLLVLIVQYVDHYKKQRTKYFVGANYLILFLAIIFTWYLYIADGEVISTIGLVINTISRSLDFFSSSDTAAGINIATMGSNSIVHIMYTYLNYALIGLVALGMVSVVLKRVKNQNQLSHYECMALANFIILVLFSFFPIIGFSLGIDRILQISLLILGPLLIFGACSLFTLFNNVNLIRKKLRINPEKISGISIAVLLSILLIFNTGLAYFLVNDPNPKSIVLTLDPSNYENGSIPKETASLKVQTVLDSEASAATWLKNYRLDYLEIRTTVWSSELKGYGVIQSIQYIDLEHQSTYNGYTYIDAITKIYGYEIVKESLSSVEIKDIPNIEMLNDYQNKIYCSDASSIYKS